MTPHPIARYPLVNVQCHDNQTVIELTCWLKNNGPPL